MGAGAKLHGILGARSARGCRFAYDQGNGTKTFGRKPDRAAPSDPAQGSSDNGQKKKTKKKNQKKSRGDAGEDAGNCWRGRGSGQGDE